MNNNNFKKILLNFVIGLSIGGLIVFIFLNRDPIDNHLHESGSDEYHIHADFLIQTGDIVQNLGTAEFTTSAKQKLHEDAHIHNENGDMLHLHEKNVSFVEFLNSLGIKLTEDCLTLKTGESFCNNELETLTLFVNNEPWTNTLKTYIPNDLDRVLLYYGDAETKSLNDYIEAIPTDACIYSGSCPERGIAPAEECGLTCEL